MNIIDLVYNILLEKRAKLKPLSGYDYYKSIRKPTPPTGTSFKDKKKYDRKEKFKKDYSD
jgi:hypothetical protein